MPGRSIIVSVHVVGAVAAVAITVAVVRFGHCVHAGEEFHNFITAQDRHSTTASSNTPLLITTWITTTIHCKNSSPASLLLLLLHFTLIFKILALTLDTTL